MITEGSHKGITSKDVRHMLNGMKQAATDGEAKLALLEKELKAIKGEDQRRPIYLNALKQMRALSREFKDRIRTREKELSEIEREERRPA